MEFSWISDLDIERLSTFEVETVEDLNDNRLGATLKKPCLICGNTYRTCSGHFGRYSFKGTPLIHPLMLQEARRDLKEYGFKRKVKVSQNILQVKSGEEWKALTFFELEDWIENVNSRTGKRFPWLRSCMPIPPPCVRPSCYSLDRGLSLNDLTHRLSAIVRIDKVLQQAQMTNPYNTMEHRRVATRAQLAYTLLLFPPPGSNSRELSTMSDRFKGKEGRMRSSLLGKRLTFSARSVITGDPLLRLTELGVPEEIAETLSKPVRAAAFNMDYLNGLLKKDQILCVVRNGMRFNPAIRQIELKVSDICHVKLQDGMRVLFNRQPTLWRSSVQCLYVRRLKKKTFSINCEITPAFNADCK